MQYRVTKVELINTSTGKTFKKVELSDANGSYSASVWPDSPLYAVCTEGADIDGIIKQNGKYSNLVAGNLGARPSYAKRADPMAVQKVISTNVAKTQDRKEEGIKTSSSIRMATDVVVAMMKSPNNNWTYLEIEAEIKRWRVWFILNWDIDPTD